MTLLSIIELAVCDVALLCWCGLKCRVGVQEQVQAIPVALSEDFKGSATYTSQREPVA